MRPFVAGAAISRASAPARSLRRCGPCADAAGLAGPESGGGAVRPGRGVGRRSPGRATSSRPTTRLRGERLMPRTRPSWRPRTAGGFPRPLGGTSFARRCRGATRQARTRDGGSARHIPRRSIDARTSRAWRPQRPDGAPVVLPGIRPAPARRRATDAPFAAVPLRQACSPRPSENALRAPRRGRGRARCTPEPRRAIRGPRRRPPRRLPGMQHPE